MMILLTDEEIEKVWPDSPKEVIDRECPLTIDELELIARQVAIAANVVAKAQLRKVVKWGIGERRKLKEKRDWRKINKPNDTASIIMLGAKIKAFQQVIDKCSNKEIEQEVKDGS